MIRPAIFTTMFIISVGGLLAACGQPAAPAAPSPAPAPPSAYADIPQGVTAEGYQYLGDPAAPVTMVMYSDFL